MLKIVYYCILCFMFSVFELAGVEIMSSTIKKSEISKLQKILNNLVDYSNLINAPILELSRKIDGLIIDYYNEIYKNQANGEDTD